MATQPGFANKVRGSLCFQSVLGFCFNKGVRGGPRVLLNLAGLVVGLYLFVKLLPSHMTEGALQAIPLPKTAWSSLGLPGNSGLAGPRIVVFGELDIGTPVGANQEREDSKTWTEALCVRVSGLVFAMSLPLPVRQRQPSCETSCSSTHRRSP